MTAEIISVGTELLLGNILNTNAQYLSRELADLGITVQRESTIGDNHGRLADFVNEARSRCDLLVFTGGLGPTADDLTKETVAACFGDELAFDEAEWDKITSYFARTGRETTPNNRKQAMVPTKGHKIINNHGTAPGAWFEQDGHCAVLMPGVPHEMKAMWTESVRPLLMERQNCTLHSVTLRVLGGGCRADRHYYDDTPAVPKPIFQKVPHRPYTMAVYLAEVAELFRGHEALRDYARSLGARIINRTEGSMIDAYERERK